MDGGGVTGGQAASPSEPVSILPPEAHASRMLVERLGWRACRKGVHVTIWEYPARLGSALQIDHVRQRRAEARTMFMAEALGGGAELTVGD